MNRIVLHLNRDRFEPITEGAPSNLTTHFAPLTGFEPAIS